MPPYILLTFASAAASLNELKERTGKPYSTSDESVNEKLSPASLVSTVAAAALTVLCPLGYSGNGGVCMYGFQSWSITSFIMVIGRTELNLYFSFQQHLNASDMAMDVSVNASAVSIMEKFFMRAASAVMASQCPPGVIFWAK